MGTAMRTLGLAAVWLAVMVVGAGAGETKKVRDWTATCSLGDCTAEAVGDDGLAMGQQGYRLRIAREAGSSAGWTVTLVASKVAQPADKAEILVAVDGKALPPARAAAMVDGERFGLAGQEGLEAIFPALRKGKHATLSFAAGGKTASSGFSLSGLAAVLLWIDDKQGRVGDSDLVQEAFAPPATETITDLSKLPQPLYDLLKLTQDCSPVDNDYMQERGVLRDWLDAQTELYSVPCWSAAYNTIERYFTIAEGVVTPMLFADYGDTIGWTGTAEMINSEYDPASRELYSFSKARGLGDCGSTGLWRWQDRMFRLIEYRFQGDCGGEDPADIDKWPIIFKAKEGP